MLQKKKKIRAYHFLPLSKRLTHGDDRPVSVGVSLSVEGVIKIGENGLHGSISILDALSYAPSPIVCIVEISGDIQEEDDMIAGRCREVLKMRDASDALHEFACLCAERYLRKMEGTEVRADFMIRSKTGAMIHSTIREAIEMKRKWLKGEVTSEQLESMKREFYRYSIANYVLETNAAFSASGVADVTYVASSSASRYDEQRWRESTLLNLIGDDF